MVVRIYRWLIDRLVSAFVIAVNLHANHLDDCTNAVTSQTQTLAVGVQHPIESTAATDPTLVSLDDGNLITLAVMALLALGRLMHCAKRVTCTGMPAAFCRLLSLLSAAQRASCAVAELVRCVPSDRS